MPWVSLDDQFHLHPKNAALSDAAFRLKVSALCHANQFLTDGKIDAECLPQLVPKLRRTAVEELVNKGHWIALNDGSGYLIRDYLEWNPSRADVLKRKQIKSEAGRKGARARWENE